MFHAIFILLFFFIYYYYYLLKIIEKKIKENIYGIFLITIFNKNKKK